MNEGRWVTISGRHVFVKNGQNPMDAYIRKKAKSETFETIDADTPKEYLNKRKEYIDKYMNIQDTISKDGSRGRLKAMVDNEIVGVLDYYKNENGQLGVVYIHVNDGSRRTGIGTKLYKQLQAKAPNQDIIFGEFTNDGEKLIKKIGKITKKEKNKDGFITYYGKINKEE